MELLCSEKGRKNKEEKRVCRTPSPSPPVPARPRSLEGSSSSYPPGLQRPVQRGVLVMEVCTCQFLLLGSPQGQALRQRRELVSQGQAWLCLYFTHSMGELG